MRERVVKEDNGATTTGAIATFPAGGLPANRKPWPLKKRRKKKKRKHESAFATTVAERVEDALWETIDADLPEPGSELEVDLSEKAGHTVRGGKGALRAWFGIFVGRRARKGAHTFRGKGKYARRRYRISKLGGGRYRLKRIT